MKLCRVLSAIKVVNGSNQCSGTVQIFRDGRWGTVCDRDWGVADAQVACRQLGCARGEAKLKAFFGLLAQQTWMTAVSCAGSERSLEECFFNAGSGLCAPENYAGIVCEGKALLL